MDMIKDEQDKHMKLKKILYYVGITIFGVDHSIEPIYSEW